MNELPMTSENSKLGSSASGESFSQHTGSLAESSSRQFRVDAAHHPASHEAAPERPARRDSKVLQQASQMLQQLQQDLAEQEQREAELATREEELHLQQAQFDAWAQRIRDELQARRTELEEREKVVDQRLDELAARLRDQDEIQESLESGRQLLQAQIDELEQQRQLMEVEINSQLAEEHAELQRFRSEVAELMTQVEVARAQLEEDRAAGEQQLEQRLKDERQQLWSAMTMEWQQHRSAFEEEQSDWKLRQLSEQAELQQLRDTYERAIQGLETQLMNRRAAFEAEANRLRDELATELHKRGREWEARQTEALADQQKEQVLAETRLRFQLEHLEKVRGEIEAQQQEFRLERQLLRQQLEDDTMQLERRQAQMKLYQLALDQQQQSLDRERDTLLKCRQAWDSTVDADRESVQAEKLAWEDTRRRQQHELQTQRESLSGLSESLERKRSRLERLRMELEDTHRTTLELRLAVEESWAQIADSVGGEEEARLRVDQARQALVLYYQELHAALLSQRDELHDHQQRFDQQRMAFHDERQTLLQWFAERDQQLAKEEERLREELNSVSSRENEWRHSRDQWLAEKLEAESLIRRLLSELGERAEFSVNENSEISHSLPGPMNRMMLAGPHWDKLPEGLSAAVRPRFPEKD